jgi:hypothetical protein
MIVVCPRCRKRPKLAHGYCAACKRIVNREWRERNPDRHDPVAHEIECLICGWTGRFLGPHLRRHDINSAEYRKRFPGAPTSSTEMLGINFDLWIDRNGPPRWTEARIISVLKRFAKRTGRVPAQSDFAYTASTRPAWMTVVNAFGTWNKALVAAGLQPRERWTKEEAIKALQEFFEVTGQIPSRDKWDDATIRPLEYPSSGPIIKLFGSWNAGMAAAGFKPRPKKKPLQRYCKRGHYLRGVNLYIKPNGKRECLRCKRLRAKGRI